MGKQNNTFSEGRALSMSEAMEYLTAHGFPCRSRSTFYRILNDFNIPYTNVNPSGKNVMRRFPVSGLKQFLQEQGIEA